ncbi:hypothetical protein PPYR_15194 [Photinus pyralis]|uniref:Uncharacterized protein n=1 Tax=Photinus pyralis TaxID=7054 RepID=A0A5N3ZZE0_PHOPY|nr:hypothetical protein PPYR_15194 [Photinus pyralis]
MPDTRSALKGEDREDQLIQRVIEKTLKNKDLMQEILSSVTQIVKQEFEQQIKVLSDKVIQLEHALEVKTEGNEQYSRINNLRIFGVPESEGENTGNVIINLCKQNLKLDLSVVDIDCAHRLPGVPNKPRPIIVKFVRRSTKILVSSNKKELKGTQYVIREDLTKIRQQLFKEIKTKFELSARDIWTSNGKIFAKINNKVAKFVNYNDLRSLIV